MITINFIDCSAVQLMCETCISKVKNRPHKIFRDILHFTCTKILILMIKKWTEKLFLELWCNAKTLQNNLNVYQLCVNYYIMSISSIIRQFSFPHIQECKKLQPDSRWGVNFFNFLYFLPLHMFSLFLK